MTTHIPANCLQRHAQLKATLMDRCRVSSSLQDSGFHGEFEYFVALLEHLVLQRFVVIDGQLAVLKDELLHDMAVVDIYGQDLSQADEHVVLDAVLGVDKRRQLLREVDCLVHGYLSGLFLVLLE